MLSKILKRLFKNRFTTAITLLILIGGYFGYQAISGDDEAVRYTVAAVEKGTLIVSVSGSGQVTVFDQVDIKPKNSGELSVLYVRKNQYVKTGQMLAELDSENAERAVRDAEIVLNDAKYDLNKARKDYDEIEEEAERSLVTTCENGYGTVSAIFFELSGYIKDLEDVLGTKQSVKEYIAGYALMLGRNSIFIENLIDNCDLSFDLYNKNFAFFRTVFHNDDSAVIYQLASDTLETTKVISRALENVRHMYDAAVLSESYEYLNIASHINDMRPKIESDITDIYTYISSLQEIKDTIDDVNENTPETIEEAELAIQSFENIVTQKEEILLDAKEELADCYIRAPFNGFIAEIGDSLKIGDSISSDKLIVTIITWQKIAEIFLNEIDVAKIKVGQKATLTFDALPDISIPGKIIEVDVIGEVSQGVVSYGVKIAFNINEEMIKPGMSVTADIIAEEKQDILVLPNSSVKFKKDFYYVEFVEADEEFGQQLLANISGTILPESLKLQIVEIGLSNDLFTEITNGLEEGDIVVVSTTNQDLEIQKATEAQGFQMMKMRSFSR